MSTGRDVLSGGSDSAGANKDVLGPGGDLAPGATDYVTSTPPAPVYLLRDQFTTTQGAPLTSPRTCEPGPGTLTLVNTGVDTSASISGGKYLRPRPNTGQGWGNYGAYSTSGFARRPGLANYAISQGSILDRYEPGSWGATAALATASMGLNFGGTSQIQLIEASNADVGSSLTANTDYQTSVVCRGAGALYLIRGGTQYPAWTLLYVSAVNIDPTLYFRTPDFGSDAKHDEVAVMQLSGSLALDYGKVVSLSPGPVSGDVATGSADGLEYFTWTPVAAETLSIYFRRISDNETYRLDCSQAGSTIKLYRRTGGVDTELNAGKTQTFTAGQQYRIGIMHAAGEIRTWVETTSPSFTAKHLVTGESFNLSSTGVKVAGFATGANLECWPRTFSGTDLETLA